MKFVDIESRFGDVVLRVTPVRHPWDTTTKKPAWDFQLVAVDLDASGVYLEDPDAPQTLTEFLRELDDNHQGFDGEKHWQSVGGLLKIRADHDQINTTRLYVTLTGGVTPEWTAQAELHVDPRRFDRVTLNCELYAAELHGDEYDESAEPERIDSRQKTRDGVRKIGSMAVKPIDWG
jgi:hypothetical protein